MKINKKDFPLLSRKENGYPICYLDNASASQKPKQVIDALVRFYTEYNANVGRGVYKLAEEATQMYEEARNKIASFIGAKSHEIIFTKNSTEGINLIAQSWARTHIKKGESIVITQLEHHSNLLPWQRIAGQTGAILKYIPVTKDGILDTSSLDTIISSDTKLVSVTQSSNAFGTQVDIDTIIKAAHTVGAKVLIDACQSVPHQKVDVKKMGADFLVFSGQKMLGPTGIGVLYIDEKHHDDVAPYNLGGGTVYSASWHEVSFVQSPQKFEAGTPPIAQAIGLGAAVDYLQANVDFEELKKFEADLCAQFIDGVAVKRVKIVGPIEQLKMEGHLVSFAIDGIHPHDVAAFLDQYGICVRAGHFCAQPLVQLIGYEGLVRASFYLYNTKKDVDRLIKGIHELLKTM